MSRRTVRLVLEYDGSDFGGWQRQDNRITVQEVLEGALARHLGEPVTTVAAGRTDAGVHALGQTVSFRTESRIPPGGILHGANVHLPDTVAIREVADASPDFHAQRDAVGKHYRYRILTERVRRPVAGRFATRIGTPLDDRRMGEAAARLVGTHDFSSFRNAGSVETSPVRTLTRLDITREDEYLSLDFEADGFLYRMVRNLVGTLLLVGRGAMDPETVGEVLLAADRCRAGPAAPAGGLCLVRVFYRNDA
ncbi:MAG: tRNA pseudouridine(38-40) synthase TruA [Planctomycetota bacterium]